MRELTPAQRHRARVLAEEAHAQTPYGQHVASSAYQLMLAKLAADKRTLKGIESVQAKAAMKAKMLPAYADWIAGALAGGGGADDVVLTTCMVWAIDAGAYALALTIAPYVLQHGLPMPDHYQRKAASILVDEMADAYLLGRWNAITYSTATEGEAIQQHGTEGAVELLAQALALTQDHDMPDQARAKLYKAVAYAALGKVQTAEVVDLDKMPRQALQDVRDLLGTAVALDALCGVKKDIERIDRKLAADAAGKVTLPTAAQAAEAAADTTAATTNPAPTARKRSAPATQPAARARKR